MHLSEEQRYQISAMLKAGSSQEEIATSIGTSQGTVSREIARNASRKGYYAKTAHEKAISRAKESHAHTVFLVSAWDYVDEKIRKDWSPEQIHGRC